MRKINEIKKQVITNLEQIIDAVYDHKFAIEPPIDKQIFVTGLELIINDNKKINQIAHRIKFDDELFDLFDRRP